MEKPIINLLGPLVIFCFLATIIYLFLLRPEIIIQMQAKFYRSIYKARSGENDANNSSYQWPLDRVFIGSRSRFIENAEDQPEQYKNLLNLYRAIGLVILLLVICATILFLAAYMTGSITSMKLS